MTSGEHKYRTLEGLDGLNQSYDVGGGRVRSTRASSLYIDVEISVVDSTHAQIRLEVDWESLGFPSACDLVHLIVTVIELADSHKIKQMSSDVGTSEADGQCFRRRENEATERTLRVMLGC